jgi:hypothetical protein
MTDFMAEMDKLAAAIAKAAGTEGDKAKAFGDQIDAFKALMPYYAIQMKNKGKNTDIDDLPNFDNFASSIHATENSDGSDEPGVRDRRRNGN